MSNSFWNHSNKWRRRNEESWSKKEMHNSKSSNKGKTEVYLKDWWAMFLIKINWPKLLLNFRILIGKTEKEFLDFCFLKWTLAKVLQTGEITVTHLNLSKKLALRTMPQARINLSESKKRKTTVKKMTQTFSRKQQFLQRITNRQTVIAIISTMMKNRAILNTDVNKIDRL